MSTAPAGAEEGPALRPEMPFEPGEELVFALKWGFVSAGEATLAVLPMETIDGVEAYHFVMTARTNSFVDLFYKIRDRFDSYTDLSMNRSLLYRKEQQEGTTSRDIEVRFDWEGGQAHYTDRGESLPPVELLPGSFDPLSIFYYVRLLELEEGAIHERPVNDGKKNLQAQLKVVARETVTVPAGTFETYKLVPDPRNFGGVFKESKNSKLHLWVTADGRRQLVKIQSKVAVGSFVAELAGSGYTSIGPDERLAILP